MWENSIHCAQHEFKIIFHALLNICSLSIFCGREIPKEAYPLKVLYKLSVMFWKSYETNKYFQQQ